MFDHERPIVIRVMCDQTFGMFDHLQITSPMDVYKRLAYTQRIIKVSALKKHQEVLVTCRNSAKEITGDDWDLVNLHGLSAEDLWTWANTYTTGYDVHGYFAWYNCVNFRKELWFELGKCIWRKHRNVYHNHMKYVCNDIVKPFSTCFG